MELIGLDEDTYREYINETGAKFGDFIIYNNKTSYDIDDDTGNEKYTLKPVFKSGGHLNFDIIAQDFSSGNVKAELIDNEILNGNFVLTENTLKWFKDLKTEYWNPAIFVDMNTYEKVKEKFELYPMNELKEKTWIKNTEPYDILKVKCNKIIEFANYIEKICNNQNIKINPPNYYGLEHQQKIIYTELMKLIMNIIIIAITTIAIVSNANIMNASLCERVQGLKLLNRLGATKKNINKILMNEIIYIFIKAIIISLILSLPILYCIISHISKVVTLTKLLIPFGNIIMFILLLLCINLIIVLGSTKKLFKTFA